MNDHSIVANRKHDYDSRLKDDKIQSISFSRVGPEHIALLKSFFDRYPSRSCDLTVGGVVIWAKMFDYEYAVLEDSLIIKGYIKDSNSYIFYSPCGTIGKDKFRAIVAEYCETNEIKGMIIDPEEEVIGIDYPKESCFGEYLPEFKEYLYPIEKFCGFPGKKMEKKRNHLHHFINNYSPYEIKEICNEDIIELIEFTLKFETEHNDSETSEYECRELINVLKNYSDYPFNGITVRHDGKIIAYSFGEKSGDTFIIHAEKANIEYKGVYQAVASFLAEMVHETYPEVQLLNREDDMGDESLRQSKESYHPSIYVHKRRYFVR